MSIITANDLCLWYGTSQALKNINIEIEPNSITYHRLGCDKSIHSFE